MALSTLIEFSRIAFRRLWDVVANEAANYPGTHVEVLHRLTSKLHAAEDLFHHTSLGPSIAASIRKLADLAPRKLAVMHGASFEGDGAASLRTLAGHYDQRLR